MSTGALAELTTADIIRCRSWLLKDYSRDVSSKVLTSLHSMIKDLVGRGGWSGDVAAGVHVTASSRWLTAHHLQIKDLAEYGDDLARARQAPILALAR
jgi:integrase